MKKNISLLATFTLLTLATNAATQVYDLKADWSDTANPNGPWSYREGTSLLHSGVLPFVLGEPIAAWLGSDNTAPFMYLHWSSGDATVIPGCSSCGEGIPNILWTAPSAGTIDVSGGIWDSESFGGDAIWTLSHNGTFLSDGQFSSGDWYDSSFPLSFSLGSGGSGALQNIPVAAGDQVVLALVDGPSHMGIAIGVYFTIALTPDAVDPISAIEDLATTVVGMNLQNGIENSLDSKLDAALNALVDANFNNDGAACNSLAAFISAVEAQRGNRITSAQADQLIASAQQIQASLNRGN